MITVDLNENKKIGNKKINMKGRTADEQLVFTNGLNGQVEYVKNGGNVVVKVYAQNQYTIKRTTVYHSAEKVTEGKNKGKYEKFVTIRKGIIKNGEVEFVEIINKPVAYVSQKGNNTEVNTYQIYKNNKLVLKTNSVPDTSQYTNTVNKNKLLGTYTITNAGKQADSSIDVLLTSADYTNKKLLHTIWEIFPDKKGMVKGTNLNENVTSTANNEVFDMKGGVDTITFDNNNNIGKDVVKVSPNSYTNLSFYKNVTYSKRGNDIIISSGDKGQVTLKNYFDHPDATIKVGMTDLRNILNSINEFKNITATDMNKSQTEKGTLLNETFTGSNQADKIYTGAGDDTINPNGGNDKIYINGNGTKTINLSNTDGNNTVYDSYKADQLNLNFTNSDAVFYIKSGNNLIVQGYTGNFDDPNPTTNITLNNWFKKNCKLAVTVKSSSNTTDFKSDLDSGKRKLYVPPAKTMTGSNYGDNIYAGMYTKNIDAKGGNNFIEVLNVDINATVNIKAGTGNDTYQIDQPRETHIISDAGGNDKLVLTDSKSGYKMFFNVTKSGKADTTMHLFSTNNWSVSNIAKNKKIKDTATIKNYLTSDKQEGKGYIETIKINGSGETLSLELNTVASQVASWLTTGGRNYNSAIDVIKSGNETDINALLQMYSTK